MCPCRIPLRGVLRLQSERGAIVEMSTGGNDAGPCLIRVGVSARSDLALALTGIGIRLSTELSVLAVESVSLALETVSHWTAFHGNGWG